MIAPPLRVEPVPAGARVVARDWPFAPWVAGALLAAGLPLLVWSAADRRPIEGGGALVFVGFGTFAAWLALAKRRDVVVTREGGAVRVRGREGAGPAARGVDVQLPPETVVEVVPFAVPEGAPALPDRGGDLVLAGGGSRLRLARAVGPGWLEELGRAATALRSALGNEDSRHPPA